MNNERLPEPDDDEPEITILAGSPTPTELAAVTSVIAALSQEVSDDAAREPQRVPSAWQHSQRAIRKPITPGPGAWRAF